MLKLINGMFYQNSATVSYLNTSHVKVNLKDLKNRVEKYEKFKYISC